MSQVWKQVRQKESILNGETEVDVENIKSTDSPPATFETGII